MGLCQRMDNCRGVAFARSLFKLITEIYNSQMLRPLCFYRSLIPAVWRFRADVRGLGAEHSHIERIANFINPIDLLQQIRRGVAFARSLFKPITEISIRKCCALCAFTDRLSLRFGDLGRVSEV